MKPRLVLALVALVWGLVVYTAGLHFMIPAGDVFKRIQAEISQSTKGGWLLEAQEVSLWRLTGLKLKEADVLKVDSPRSRPRGAAAEDEAPVADVVLAFDRLAARLELLPLLSGKAGIGMKGRLHGGKVSGRVLLSEVVSGEPNLDKLAVSISKVDLSQLPLSGETVELSFGGLLGLDLDLDMDPEDVTRAEGQIILSLEEPVLRSGAISGFKLPEDTRFSDTQLTVDVSGGKARIKRGRVEGDLLEAEVEGEITLNKNLSRSRLRIQIHVGLEPDMDNLVRLMPGARDARGDDGKYHFLLTGTLQHPNFRPDSARKPGRRRGITQPERPVPTPQVGGQMPPGGPHMAGPDMDQDERRRLREERIRQRRERMMEREEEARRAQAEDDLEYDDLEDDDFDDFHDEPFRDGPPPAFHDNGRMPPHEDFDRRMGPPPPNGPQPEWDDMDEFEDMD